MTYAVRAERTRDRWWLISVDELDIKSQARRLDQVEAMARDLIATWLDIDPASVEVDLVEIDPGADVQRAIDASKAARAEADAASTRAAKAGRDAARAALASGMTGREASRLLGVSHQRVNQLATSDLQARRLLPRDSPDRG